MTVSKRVVITMSVEDKSYTLDQSVELLPTDGEAYYLLDKISRLIIKRTSSKKKEVIEDAAENILGRR